MRASLRRLVTSLVLACLIGSCVSAAAASARSSVSIASRYFRGPGGNVVCGYFSGVGLPPLLECGVARQLVPPPPHPKQGCGGLDFAGNRIRLDATGRAFGFCTGDAGVMAQLNNAPRLPYGKTWQRGPFSCTVSPSWVSCSNTTGRGFSINRYRWRAH
jgi:hypothetical protein